MSQYTHLSMSDRCRLFTFLEMKLPMSEISRRLNKHRSTLYREIDRNSELGSYLPKTAQLKAKDRAQQKRLSKLDTNGVLQDYVVRSLKKGWSPEKISGRMKYHQLSFYACHELIYQFVYRSKNKALYHCLPYKRPRRQQRHSRQKNTCRYGKIRLITHRPEEIETRKRFGHWEGDLIEFRGTKKKTITTLVERKSRLVFLIKNKDKYSSSVMGKIKTKLANLPNKMCKTITFDQGSEFADYRHLERPLSCKVYYCETHSPWQKGSNENMNGRVRWYLPRETNINTVTQTGLDQLAAKLNHCPRKCLGYKTLK